MTKNHVVLLGDSTIDNICWVGSFKKSIPGILKQNLNEEEWKITNYAADGFTTTNMLTGAAPYISYVARKRDDPFPMESDDEIFEPLKELKKLNEVEKVTHIVLSVGGNDVRVILNRMERLLTVFPTFQKNYEDIVNELLTITPNVIVMTQYRPAFHQDRFYRVYHAMKSIPFLGGNTGVQNINLLLSMMYNKMFEETRAKNIPIIDLSNTFNPYYTSLFTSQIEPSYYGSQLIAGLISHVLNKHTWENPSSIIYTSPPLKYTLEDHKVTILGVDEVVNNAELQWKVIDLPEDTSPDRLLMWSEEDQGVDSEKHVGDGDNDGNSQNEKYKEQITMLREMGFKVDGTTTQIIQACNGNMEQVIELLSSNL